MGGTESELFILFKLTIEKIFVVLKKYKDEIMDILKIMSKDSPLPCFKKLDLAELESRFGQNLSDAERTKYVEELIFQSFGSTSTSIYDTYQLYTNNIQS